MSRAEAPRSESPEIPLLGERANRLLRKLRKHRLRAASYIADALWLQRDFLKAARWRSLRIIIVGGLYIASKLVAMGALYLLVHAISEGWPEQLSSLPLPPPNSGMFVVLGVAVAVGLLSLSSWLRYDVRREGVRLGRFYEELCARRLVAAASRLPDSRCPEANRVFASTSFFLYTGYARISGMAARQLAQLLPTLVSFIVVCLALLWIDARTTGGLALLAAIALLAQYPANHRSAQASLVWERQRSPATQRYLALFRQLRRAPVPLNPYGALLDHLFASGPVREAADAFSGRSLAGEQASLASRVGSHLVLGGAVLLVGLDIVDGERTWASVAAYVAALRFALSDFVTVSKLATGFTKFHAQLALYRRFILSAAAAMSGPAPRTLGLPAFKLRDPDGRSKRLVLGHGELISLVVPPVSGAAPISHLLSAAGVGGETVLMAPPRVERTLLDPNVPLCDLLGFGEKSDETALADLIRQFSEEGELPAGLSEGWLSRPSTIGWDRELPLWFLAGLQVMSFARRGVPLVTIDVELLEELALHWLNAAREQLRGAVVMLLRQPRLRTRDLDLWLDRVGDADETAVIIGDRQRLLAWAPLSGRGTMSPSLREAYRQAVEDHNAGQKSESDQDPEEEDNEA